MVLRELGNQVERERNILGHYEYRYVRNGLELPDPYIRKLSEMYPDIPFEVAFADEDIGNNCGILHYALGEGGYTKLFSSEEEAIAFAESIWDGAFEFEGE